MGVRSRLSTSVGKKQQQKKASVGLSQYWKDNHRLLGNNVLTLHLIDICVVSAYMWRGGIRGGGVGEYMKIGKKGRK